MKNRFNLIDEAWIPVVNVGKVGLRELFTHDKFHALGGDPIQKIAIMKLLQALAQAAITPKNIEEWLQLGYQGMAKRLCDYLDRWHDRFYLYGKRPFLQMPTITQANIRSFTTVLPNIATGNTTVLNSAQLETPLDDADKALLLLTQMGFSLGGKKSDNSVVLTPNYLGKRNEKGKPTAGKPGPAVSHLGLLHSYCLGTSILESIWLNLFTKNEITKLTTYSGGLGKAPWEQMPQGEDCNVAKALKKSLMGRLVPLSRFCLLVDTGLHYSEGIAHDGHNKGIFDPSVTIDIGGIEITPIWADPELRPWRKLTYMLGFLGQKKQSDCIQLRLAHIKASKLNMPISIWSGGIQVSSHAGEQYISGLDDMVESANYLPPRKLVRIWFHHYQTEMKILEQLAKSLYNSVNSYFNLQLLEGKYYARKASYHFWYLCEQQSQILLDSCDRASARQQLRRQFANYITRVFDQTCPRQTPRQLDSWAKTRPNYTVYLK